MSKAKKTTTKKKELSQKQKDNLKKGQLSLQAKRKAKKEPPQKTIAQVIEELPEEEIKMEPFETKSNGEYVLPKDDDEDDDVQSAASLFNFTGGASQNETQGLPGNLDQIDIWEFAYKKLIKQGDVPYYLIYKNGALLTQKYYPYSWTELKDEFGGGHYRVDAKSSNTHQIVKKQTQLIAKQPNDSLAPQREEMPQEKKEDVTQMVKNIADLITQMNDKAKADVMNRESSNRQADNSFNALIMQSIQQQAKAQSDVAMQLMKFQMESNNQVMGQMQKMIEGIAIAIKDTNSSKKEGPDAFQLMEMMDKRSELAEKRTIDLLDRMEKKVMEAKDMWEDDDDDDDAPRKDEPLSDTLIKSFVPVVAQMMNQNMQKQMNQQLDPNQIKMIQSQMEAEELRQKEKALEARTNQSAKPRIMAKPLGATSRPPIVSKPVSLKDKIDQLLLPSLLNDATSGASPVESARKSLGILKNNNISLKEALENFKIDDIMSVARQYQLDAKYLNWIKEFYANLEIDASNVPIRQAPTSQPVQTI